jgi:enoyl-CoA hydratase/carnithine racemase
MADQMETTVDVKRDRRAGRIRLNRPKALNALDLDMIAQVHAALEDFAADPTIHLVILEAAGGKAFSAGGDIRAIREASLAGDAAGIEAFFASEYRLNQAIADFRKPWVSLIDGICMGGGLGLSVHGSHRIATERAVFAMPETSIALFPDIGATYFLPRLPGALGFYLAVTGARLVGADGVHGGIATHYVPSARIAALGEALAADGVAALAGFAEVPPQFSLASERAFIDDVFGAATVAEIVAKLEASTSGFAQTALAAMRGASPSSIHWSFEALRRGARSNLPQCLAREFALVRKVALSAEFHEGVRAILVDKDRQPRWSPASLEAVDPAVIAAVFA